MTAHASLSPEWGKTVLAWQLPPACTMKSDKKGHYYTYLLKGSDVRIPIMVVGIHPSDFQKCRKWNVEVVSRIGVTTVKLSPSAKGIEVTTNGFYLSEDGLWQILPMLRKPGQSAGKAGIRQASVRAQAETQFA